MSQNTGSRHASTGNGRSVYGICGLEMNRSILHAVLDEAGSRIVKSILECDDTAVPAAV